MVKTMSEFDDLINAMWLVLSMIFIGAMIGLILHHWPFPVDGSVLIPNQ